MRGILAGDALGPCQRGAGEGPPRVAVTQPSRALCSHFLATLPSCSRAADLGGMVPPSLRAAPGRRVGGALCVGGLLAAAWLPPARTPSEQGRAHRYACCTRGDQGPVGPGLEAAGSSRGREREKSAFLSNRSVGQWTDLLGRVTDPYT